MKDPHSTIVEMAKIIKIKNIFEREKIFVVQDKDPE